MPGAGRAVQFQQVDVNGIFMRMIIVYNLFTMKIEQNYASLRKTSPTVVPIPGQRNEAASPMLRRFTAQEILGGAPEIGIEHHGALYRLRLTSQGKLILTK